MLINKIKLNYNIKLIDNYFDNKEYTEIRTVLFKYINDKNLFSQLLNYAVSKHLLTLTHQDFYLNKTGWIISFDQNDIKYIKKFLSIYFESMQKKNVLVSSYQSFMQDGVALLTKDSEQTKILFDTIVEHSHLYQTASLLCNSNINPILSTSSAFFESSSKKYFIYPSTSRAYIQVVRHPLQIYLNQKKLGFSHQESLNYINFVDQNLYPDQLPNQPPNQNILIPENKQSWNVNTQSWKNENVQSTYRGKTIKYEDLVDNPEEILLEILFHFKQSGFDFDINYDFVTRFVENQRPEIDVSIDISKQEMKTIANSLDKDLLDEFEYKI